MNATQEEWRPVVGWETSYEVSTLGRVRTISRLVPCRGGQRRIPQIIRRVFPTASGYFIVGLSRNGRQHSRLVHQLVLEAFVGPRPDDMEACHYDGDKANNSLSNLRWDTKGANLRDAVRIGTRQDPDRTHCRNGHDLTASNAYVNTRGIRECRRCRADVHAEYVDAVKSGRRKVRHRTSAQGHRCKNGHDLTVAANVYSDYLGNSRCRECRRVSQRKYKDAQRNKRS